MRKAVATLVLVAVLATTASANTWSSAPSKDVMADTSWPTYNHGAYNRLYVGSSWPVGTQKQGAWLAWNLPADLANSVVTSATLTLKQETNGGSCSTVKMGINVMTHDWTEGTGLPSQTNNGADVQTYNGSSLWNNSKPMGYDDRVLTNGVPTVYDSQTVTIGNFGNVVFNMTDVVKYWAQGGANYGIFIQAPLDSSYDTWAKFYSREAAGNAPVLSITYFPAKSWSAAPSKDTRTKSAFATYDYGADTELVIGDSQTAGAWLQWSLPSDLLDSIVTSAILTCKQRYNTGDMTIGVNVMAHNWVEGTGSQTQTNDGANFYTYDGINNWTQTASMGWLDRILDDEGNPLLFSSVAVPSQPNPGHQNGVNDVVLDMTGVVQHWAEYNDNNGIFLKMLETGDQYAILWSREEAVAKRPSLTIKYDPNIMYVYSATAQNSNLWSNWNSVPSKDTMADTSWPTYNYGAYNRLQVGSGWPVGTQKLGSWLSWSLPQALLDGAANSATLTLKQETNGGSSSSLEMGINVMTHSWTEGTGTPSITCDGADVQTYNGSSLWNNNKPMGYDDRVASGGVPVVYDSQTVTIGNYSDVVFDMTDAVNYWTGGGSNYGIFIQAALDSSYDTWTRFYSKEAASNKPSLSVNYSAPVTWTSTTSKDTMADYSYSTSNYGATTQLQTSNGNGIQYDGTWMAWDLPDDLRGSIVKSATLTCKQRYNTGAMTVGVNVMTRNWLEGTGDRTLTYDGIDWFRYDGKHNWTDSATYPMGYKDRVLDSGGTPVVFSSVNVPYLPYPGHENGVADFVIDMTDAVQYWADYGENYGIFLQMLSGTERYMLLWSKEQAGKQPSLSITYCPQRWSGTVTNTIHNRDGQAMSGATVKFLSSGVKNDVNSVQTNGSGQATLSTGELTVGGAIAVKVADITSSNKAYNPVANRTDDYTIITGGNPVPGKIICWGHDMLTAQALHDNITELEKTYVDGIVIEAVTDDGRKIGNTPGTEDDDWWFDKNLTLNIDDFDNMTSLLNSTNFTRFTDNFLNVWLSAGPNTIAWDDNDILWNRTLDKCRVISQLCANAHLKGINFDLEQYPTGAPMFFNYGTYSGLGNFDTVKALVRSKAQAIAQALCQYCPGIVITVGGAYDTQLDCWTTLSESNGSEAQYQSTTESLGPAFIDGLLQGLGNQARLVNRYQGAYPYISGETFRYGKKKCQDAITRFAGVSTALTDRIEQSFGVWIDFDSSTYMYDELDVVDYNNNHYTPANFRNAVHNALNVADSGYVWVYEEYAHWWTVGQCAYGPDPGMDYRLALAQAKYGPTDACPDGISDSVVPNAASTYSGWDDTSTFGDLWSSYDELYNFPDSWDFYQDKDDSGRYLGLTNRTQILHSGWWETINIREWWERQGFTYNGAGLYRKTFTLTDGDRARNLYLAFGAVANDARVWVNGTYLTQDTTGGRFLVALPSNVTLTGTNSVVVRVVNKTGPGGIWKSVKLIADRMYVEKIQDITIGTAGAWTDVDLSGYGVGANQVVEMGIRNSNTSTARSAGVRTKGSSIDRKVTLHYPATAGWSTTTMLVKTDANKKIQAYAANTSDIHFYLIGIWNKGDFVETYQTLINATTGSWTDSADLSIYGVGANNVVEVMGMNTSTSTAYICGIRAKGSALERKITLRTSTSGANDCLVMQAKTDASKKIQVYKGNTAISFVLLGYWTTAPGTYTEKFVDVGKPASSASWMSRSLSGQSVPAYALCDMLIANASTTNHNNVGVRKTGSALSKLFDIHKSSASTARECCMMHVEADSSSTISQYLQNSGDTVNFYLLGYWN